MMCCVKPCRLFRSVGEPALEFLFAPGAGNVLMLSHFCFEDLFVSIYSALFRELRYQFVWKAVGRHKKRGVFSRYAAFARYFLEFFHTSRERVRELFLFLPNAALYCLVGRFAAELRIRVLVFFYRNECRAHEHTVFRVFVGGAKLVGVNGGAPNEASENVAAF